MTGQRANTAGFAGALSKILAEESRRGYDNRTVIGGLDKFRERWQAEMTACAGETPDAAFLLRQSYAGMPPEQREAWAEQWTRLIEGGATEPAKSSVPATPRPERPAPSARSAPLPARPASPSTSS